MFVIQGYGLPLLTKIDYAPLVDRPGSKGRQEGRGPWVHTQFHKNSKGFQYFFVLPCALFWIETGLLVERIRAPINSWTARFLSYVDRFQLLRSVIASITNFWTATFRLPRYRELMLCFPLAWTRIESYKIKYGIDGCLQTDR